MPTRRMPLQIRAGSLLAILLLVAACTPGGQFDPTEMLSSDVFSNKKKIQGDREPLFPNGVPGTETGVPPDLVKGYQPPPDQAADSGDAAVKAAAAPAKPEPPPKRKPRPKIARASAKPAAAKHAHDAVWNQKAASPAPTNWPTPQSTQAQTNWPAPPATQGQTNWPASPSTQVQTNWPAPPPVRQTQ